MRRNSKERTNTSIHSTPGRAAALFPEYQLVKSSRRSMGMQIKNGQLVVRVPFRVSIAETERFIEQHADWLERHGEKLRKAEAAAAECKPLSTEDLKKLTAQAKQLIPKRVAYFAPLVGVKWNKISIRRQKTKWGSCTSKGDLSFNSLLMLAPSEVIDSVVVHELCHLKEMNHSERFYAEVMRVMPDYRQRNRWLKENGPILLKLAENAAACGKMPDPAEKLREKK